uniref:Relaxin-3 n=1 Tax=Jaculus jaculus TaxID=51337 RepID=A0A8C5KSN8_JACJA
MAPGRLLLLLLTLCVLSRELQARPFAVKLCGREFIRAVIFTCGGSRWRRAEALPRQDAEDTFSEANMEADSLAGEVDETLSSSEWLALTRSLQAFYGAPRSWQSPAGVLRDSRDVLTGLSTNCCKWGCSRSDISSLC